MPGDFQSQAEQPQRICTRWLRGLYPWVPSMVLSGHQMPIYINWIGKKKQKLSLPFNLILHLKQLKNWILCDLCFELFPFSYEFIYINSKKLHYIEVLKGPLSGRQRQGNTNYQSRSEPCRQCPSQCRPGPSSCSLRPEIEGAQQGWGGTTHWFCYMWAAAANRICEESQRCLINDVCDWPFPRCKGHQYSNLYPLTML